MSTTLDGQQTVATAPTAEEFAQRLLDAILGAQFVQAAYLGDRLGYYRALAESGALTSSDLAARTGTAERYAREWLEHQAVAGVLTVDDQTAAPSDRRFHLPAGPAEALTDPTSPAHVLPMARMVGGLGKRLDALVEAYRSGGGVSWAEFGEDAREGQGGANRPLFLGALPRQYLPSIPEVAAVLDGGRIADVGCGVGWSSIGIALAHPSVSVDGYDVDAPSIEAARANAAAAGVADRVRFSTDDVATVPDRYDLVAAFECVHDMPDPVSVLAAMRRLAEPDGVVLVMDENVAETFTAPGDDVERLMYGWSITCCLPDGLSTPGSVGTGTVMRPDTLRRYAVHAGFATVDVLPVQDDFFRFYRLRAPSGTAGDPDDVSRGRR
ncbi:methyltransferase domain-containing protein [Blastococcus sp. CT_GayMR19]|uniref:class I SAM-dependent methyltransferase n=1 Tax=Blastococcus sp. CT_GayMR19 TaxID=2559608 RepID=UPI0010745FF5|nr:methyltransferase domain-containing protein [Blastococcus sp. CT_GayMR19]TFV77509.1 methyltransferase domain-containing protein [Blastococcus sp. CT_GayMR19]